VAKTGVANAPASIAAFTFISISMTSLPESAARAVEAADGQAPSRSRCDYAKIAS
jgi:hypothetical protein